MSEPTPQDRAQAWEEALVEIVRADAAFVRASVEYTRARDARPERGEDLSVLSLALQRAAETERGGREIEAKDTAEAAQHHLGELCRAAVEERGLPEDVWFTVRVDDQERLVMLRSSFRVYSCRIHAVLLAGAST